MNTITRTDKAVVLFWKHPVEERYAITVMQFDHHDPVIIRQDTGFTVNLDKPPNCTDDEVRDFIESLPDEDWGNEERQRIFEFFTS